MTTISSPPERATERCIAGWLTPDEFAILEAICDTLLPSLEAPPGSSEAVIAYYRRCARDLHIAQRIADMLGREKSEVKQGYRRFWSLLATPAIGLLLTGSARPFVALEQTKRERYLLALANSPLGILRQAYQGIKRLAGLLYFSALNDQGINPNWAALDYVPPEPPPAVPQPIQPLAISEDTTLEADVVVIGSGAGGGVVAGELARAGKSVIVVEKGGYNYEGNFTLQESQAMSQLYLNGGMLATRDLGIMVMAGSTLGGGTVVNWMTSFRTPEDVLEEWDQDSRLHGCFTGSQLQQSFAAVEQRICVNSEHSQHNRHNQLLFDGATALGYHAGIVRRNAVGCEQRCGTCSFGCRYGCKQSTLKTYLQDAYDHGARIIVHATAERILVEHGQATGLEGKVQNTQTGANHRLAIRAKCVVVAAGALNTPVLLSRSGVENAHIGRHLHLHPATISVGVYPEKVYAWQGVLQSAYCAQFTHLDGNYGYIFEVASAHPGLFGMATPWYGARDYRGQTGQMAHLASFIAVVRDKGEGTVKVGRAGESIVDYVVSVYDRKHILHGLQQGAYIHMAAGAERVISLQNKPTYLDRSPHGAIERRRLQEFGRKIERHGLGPNRVTLVTAHQMGSCRMGADPSISVVDGHNQVHGIKGLFVCDASIFPSACGVNPMLTIMALAHRASQYIKAEV
jgi:choline dehydrogenase-like flavoprotein